MISLSLIVRSPMYHYEVTMNRRATSNECQNVRKRIEYVRAPNDKDAIAEANKRRPEFTATRARRV